MANPLRDAFSEVLRDYVYARTTERIGRASSAWRSVMSIPAILAETPAVRSRPCITTRASAGQGGWARIPWVALLHADAAPSTRDGIYVIYLFAEDMSGFYLTLNQGVTEPTRRLGTAAGLAYVRGRAQMLRERLAAIVQHGFDIDSGLNLRSTFATAHQYVASTIAHRFYSGDSLPNDGHLLDDLGHALEAYESLVSAG